MTPLCRFLSEARSRLYLSRAVVWAGRGLLGAAFGFLALATVDRLFAWGLPVYEMLAAAAVLCAASGLALGRLRRVSLLDVAMALDERLQTDERLSSALALEAAQGEFAQRVRDEAEQLAPGLAVNKAFPLRLPASAWAAAGVLALGVVAAECVGALDLLGREQAGKQAEEEQRDVRTHAVVLERRARQLLAEVEEKNLGDSVRLIKEFHEVSRDLASKPHSRRDAMVKLSKIGDRLQQEEHKSQALSKLAWKSRASKSLTETQGVAGALGKEEYDRAAKAAEELAAKVQAQGEDRLTPEQGRKLAEELRQLAKAAQEASPELAQTLEKAAEDLAKGDGQAAAESLKKAADQMAMMQQMAESSEAARRANRCVVQARQGISAGGAEGLACPRCGMPLNEFGNCPHCSGAFGSTGGQAGAGGEGQGMGGQGGNVGQAGQGAGQMGAGQGQGMGAGQQGLAGLGGDRLAGQGGQGGSCAGQGGAFGGPGQGRGGVAPRSPDQGVQWVDVKVQGEVHPGEVLASVRVKGVPKTGEAAVKYAEVYTEYRRQAEDALGHDVIPLGYRQHVRDYFDEIQPKKD